jgi:hypothetical protein
VKRAVFIIAAVALVVAVVLIFRARNDPHGTTQSINNSRRSLSSSQAPAGVTTESIPSSTQSSTNGTRFLGEKLLRGYGASNVPPEHDLELMSHLIENSLLLSKGAAGRPLSANEDWAEFLLGRSATHEPFLATNHPALNQRGQLIDRWGTPLFFHSLGSGKFDLRSAGPDQKMWTADDLHRNANGTLRRGADLNPTSLFPTNQ